MPGTQEIRTRCLLLRRHATEDANPLYENFGKDPAMFEYTGWNPYATPRMAEERAREFIDAYADPRFYG
jgi:ribosomal-protein-alanine N-acetyltransferase